ncbi:MAG TPA: hypothetical protein VMM12_01620 [Longimicrobiales bacterium]|nr:hypothetical protein [Longimicrobiales bacterium]
MRTHVKVLGWLYIILGLLGVLGAMVAFGVLSGIGLLSGDIEAFGFFALLGGLAGIYLTIISIPNIICGLGLLRGWRGWVLILAVILAILNLPNFPFGTALAFYTFWVVVRLSNAAEATST